MSPRKFSIFWLLCLIAGLGVLAWGGSWILAERRFQAGLKQAKADMDAKRFEVAGAWLFLYGFARFFLSFYYAGSEALPVPELMAVLGVIAGGVLWLRHTKPEAAGAKAVP